MPAQLPASPDWINTVTGPNLKDGNGNNVGRMPNLQVKGPPVTSDPLNQQNIVDLSEYLFVTGTLAKGDIAFFDGTQWQRLPIGTSGQKLTVVSGSVAWV